MIALYQQTPVFQMLIQDLNHSFKINEMVYFPLQSALGFVTYAN